MPDYYLRKGDPLAPVYEVDTAAGTWRLAASRIGVLPDVGGALNDSGARFRSDDFAQVWPKGDVDGVVTYTLDDPATANERGQS